MNPTLEDTLDLVIKNHKGQKDKQERPYIRHLLNVVSNLSIQKNVIYSYMRDDIIHVALLHDIIEDTTVDLDKLKELDYPESIIIAVDILTKPKKRISYLDYIYRIKESKVQFAVEVKKADLITNLSDIDKLEENDKQKRHHKYIAALAILNS